MVATIKLFNFIVPEFCIKSNKVLLMSVIFRNVSKWFDKCYDVQLNVLSPLFRLLLMKMLSLFGNKSMNGYIITSNFIELN